MLQQSSNNNSYIVHMNLLDGGAARRRDNLPGITEDEIGNIQIVLIATGSPCVAHQIYKIYFRVLPFNKHFKQFICHTRGITPAILYSLDLVVCIFGLFVPILFLLLIKYGNQEKGI